VVEFVGRVQRMVRIHQEGVSDKPNCFSREVKYDARPLLGFSASDKDIVKEMVTEFFSE
jgi:phage virion morphogenesis protein